MSTELAEAQAVQLGVKCALEKGVLNVVVAVDSQTVYFVLMRK